MDLFKKHNKKIKENKTNVLNIDEKHNDIMNSFFVVEKDTIPKLTEEKTMLKKKKKHLETNGKQHTDEYFELQDRLSSIRNEIKELQIKKKRYLLENSKYIFNYYEEKQKMSNGKNTKNIDSINQFFKIKFLNIYII